MQITAALVKQLRDRTGAGMLDCKKALTETDGDIEKAVEWLREKGVAKAAKKADRIAAEGLTKVAINGNTAVLVELNSETDFVAKNEQFRDLIDVVTALIAVEHPEDLEAALALRQNDRSVNDMIIDATATIGERITLRRFSYVEKTDTEVFGQYIHMNGKISAVSVLSDGADEALAKDMAMQVASMNPQYVSREEMPHELVEKERATQLEIVKNDPALASKPEKVLHGIVEGRLTKSLQDMCLVDQVFFKEPDVTVGKYLNQHGASVIRFGRYAVGEGIEKREDNFAEEVAKMTK